MSIHLPRRAAMLAIAATFVLSSGSQSTMAQSNIEVFGQNRLQHRKFDWRYFDTKHFRIYHYDAAGRTLARYVAEQVENDIKVIEKRMGGQFPRKFKIILYNSYDEYRQTNIGRRFESQLQDVPTGTLDLVGDKLVVYFTGEHADLHRQTREGMSRVIIERALFGDNIREIVRNYIALNLPNWTLNGFISYLVDGWDAKSNSEWKNLLEAKPKAGFFEFGEKYPDLAGKAFWKYIADRYGDNQMKSLLYTMEVKSNLNVGIKTALGKNVKKVYDSAIAYYKEMYAKDEMTQEHPDSTKEMIAIKVPTDGTTLRDMKIAPKGTDVAYVTWKNGEFKVWLQKTHGEQVASAILDGGKLDYNEQPDPNYPILTWSNNGYKLAVLYRKGRNTMLRVFNSYTAKVENYTIPPNRFDRVLSMTYNTDDDKLILSAIKKSQTDLFEFTLRGSRLKNITNDQWDDVEPCFVSGGSRRGILFLSNRSKANIDAPAAVNELPSGPMNVFFYNTRTKRKELLQMSHVTTGHVTQPIQYGGDNYAYLYDDNGVVNQYLVLIKRNSRNGDTAYGVPVTNYNSNVINHQYNPAGSLITEVVQDGGQYKVYYKTQQIPGKNLVEKQPQPTALLQTERRNEEVNTRQEASRENESSLKSGNTFKSEFKDDENAVLTRRQRRNADAAAMDEEINTKQAADSEYLKMKAQPYRLLMKPDFFTVKIDNTVLFNRYQPVALTGGKYINPPLGGMLTASLNDLMEDYRLTGGVRLPIDFTGSTYFLQFENAKHLVDWDILYLRNQTLNTYTVNYIDTGAGVVLSNDQLGKNVTNMIIGSASYPLDRMRSIRFHLGFRTDALTFKAQDTLSLSYAPDETKQSYIMSRAEYVFDNTIKPAINIYNGARYKVFAEYMYKLNGVTTGGFYNLGADIRFYKKIYKNFIWAIRAAGATSNGNMKVLYHMGGVDNWINHKYDDNTPMRPGENYAFETLATSMRGYNQNARNGNTYGLVSNEFRLPILTTFIKRPIQSSMLKNLQAVGFVDAGSAWEGFLPSKEKVNNDHYLPNGYDPTSTQVTLRIEDQSKGICVGYGGGLRTMLFGYFLRFDVAWNIETTKPVYYFALGTDF